VRFQISEGGYPFIHGYFFDENGPYFRGEGLNHLSDNFFCRADALAFIQAAFAAGQITEEEARVLEKDGALLTLPDHVPSNFERYKAYRLRRSEEKVNRKMRELKEYYGLMFYVNKFRYWLKSFIA
jgi:hypothetical protein